MTMAKMAAVVGVAMTVTVFSDVSDRRRAIDSSSNDVTKAYSMEAGGGIGD